MPNTNDGFPPCPGIKNAMRILEQGYASAGKRDAKRLKALESFALQPIPSTEKCAEYAALAAALADDLVTRHFRPEHWQAFQDGFLRTIIKFYERRPL